MTNPFLAEVRIFPFNFAPIGWAFCDGQLIPISQNTALFSLLGTNYGGDGKSTFALPNLQGHAVMHPSQGQALSDHFLGEEGGAENVQLIVSEIPGHNHTLQATIEDGTQGTLVTGAALATSVGGALYQTTTSNLEVMSVQSIGAAGADFPHNNMQPYLTLNFCIAIAGVFPQRP